MITITINWFSFILGFVACIVTAVIIGVIGFFKQCNLRNELYKELVDEIYKEIKQEDK